MIGSEAIRTIPAQSVFVPRISHTSLGVRIIPLLAPLQAYDSGVFQVRGYNKLEIHSRSDQFGTAYIYLGPDPAALSLCLPGDENEKGYFVFGNNAALGSFADQFSMQISADFARVIYVNSGFPQVVWDYQIQVKPIAEESGIRMYDDELHKLKQWGYLTLTPDYRLRVDGEFSPTAVQIIKGQPRTCWTLADALNLAPSASTPQAQILTGCSTGVPGVYAIDTIGIHCAVLQETNGASGGKLYIFHRPTPGAGAWRLYEVIPLEFEQRINKLLKPTMPEVLIYFQANASGASGVDLHVTAKPQT